MDKDNSLPPRGRSRGRGEKKSTDKTPVTPQTPFAAEVSDGNWQGGRGMARGRSIRQDSRALQNSPAAAARGRGIRQESPAAAGRALLRVPLTVQAGQESVVAVSSTLASTHIATEGESGAGAVQSVGRPTSRPPIVQRAILKTKPDSLDSKKGSSGRSVEIATNCVEKPIPSQVMTCTVISKERGLGSVCSKVAMQMCCKLGGEPWNIDFPLKDTMIMGYNANSDSSKKGLMLEL